ncbi:unnamed protein product [Rhizophagus irregularis]|nr:unnamed protein product [Rhizophagus irregularis]
MAGSTIIEVSKANLQNSHNDNDVQISDVNLRQICISDDDDELKIINLDNKQQNIELEFDEFNCVDFTKIFIEDVNEIKKDVKILSDGKFICLRISDRIIIYSIELEILIASLDKNNVIQLYKFMEHPGLYPLLLPLLLCDDVQDTGANHYIRKIKLENLPKLNFSYQNFDGLNNNSDEGSDSNKLNNENDKVIEVLDEDAKKINKKKLFVNPYIYVICALFQEDLSKPTNPEEIIKNSIKWKIEIVERAIEKEVEIIKLIKLQVFKKIKLFL